MLFPMEQYLGGSEMMRLQKANVGSVVMRGLPGECGYDWPLDLLKILTSLTCWVRNVYTYIV